MDGQADTYSEAELRARFAALRETAPWFETYRGRTVALDGGALAFEEIPLMRCAVKYGRAIQKAIALARHIAAVHATLGRDYEIELSVDETPQPTTLVEHYVIADQCLRGGMKLVSLAPRFIGDMEKGVDYLGDVAALEASLLRHAAIARATRGLFHVKTAGTSYLEALRVAARTEPCLFRRLCAFARERYDIDKATYHVHATLATTPPPDAVSDDRQLEALYLERWEDVPAGRGFTAPGRQLLHCTFGSTLTHPELGPALRACLKQNPAVYRDVLAEHFGRHLDALRAGMP